MGFTLKDDEFVCECGNTSHNQGFHPCDAAGEYMEPEGDWPGNYRCDRCDLVYIYDHRAEDYSPARRFVRVGDKHWTITVNHLEPDIELKDALPEHTVPFQLYDDDGNLYYTGLMSEKLYEAGEAIFQPLDWATYDSGCTGMKVNGPKDNGFTWV